MLLGLLADPTEEAGLSWLHSYHSILQLTLLLWVPAGCVILELLAIFCVSVSADPP